MSSIIIICVHVFAGVSREAIMSLVIFVKMENRKILACIIGVFSDINYS